MVAAIVLELTYPSVASSGILAFLAVVMDATTHGNVKLPASTPELSFLGFCSINGIDTSGFGSYIVEGVGYGLSDGSAVINPGDQLKLSGATAGEVLTKALSDGTGAVQIVGQCANKSQVPATAGAGVQVLIRPYITFST